MDDERDGVLQVGEIPVVIRRDRSLETDYNQTYRSGRESAFRETLAYVEEQHSRTPAYENTLPWREMRVFLTDRIRECNPNGSTS